MLEEGIHTALRVDNILHELVCCTIHAGFRWPCTITNSCTVHALPI